MEGVPRTEPESGANEERDRGPETEQARDELSETQGQGEGFRRRRVLTGRSVARGHGDSVV